ncbi:apolipoprotein N-acyltransferase [Prosthecobacter fusiformis]|nr:apolipoprotein N-acyltransferase [Prosthecobacter fusiformis]
MRFLNRLPRFLLPLISGGILTLAFPGANFELAAWLWLFPLLFLLWPIKSNERAKTSSLFLSGWLAGAAFWIPNLAWLRHSSRVIAGARDDAWIGWESELLGAAAVVGLALYCALYFGAWAWIVGRFAKPDFERLSKSRWQESTWVSLRSAFIAGAAWVGLEWVRSFLLFSGFGWNGLGVALHQNDVLIQITDVVGVMGLSFLPVFVACTAWNAIGRMICSYGHAERCRSRLDFTFALIVVLAVAGYGMQKLAGKRTEETMTVRTVLVQPNVAQVDAWSGELGPQVYQRLSTFTRLYAEARDGTTHTDLVIWPESALPVHLHGLPDHKPYFDELLALGDYSLLTGTELHEEGRQGHVSAVLFRDNYENRQEYNKIHLVAFGEYLPYRNIPPFSFLKGVLPGDFAPGTKAEPLLLEKPQVQLIPLICFEDTVGRLARRFVRPAPQMLVNITNDGWFLESTETEVHLANAKFRAIELHRPMVRAANTGISCFINAYGQITSRLSDPETGNTFIEGCLPGEVQVPKAGKLTFYAQWGDVFSIAMLLITGVVIAMSLLKKRQPV